MTSINKDLYDELLAGADEYTRYAASLLEKIPEEYRTLAQDGTIAIEEFAGEIGEENLEAIQEYRDWVQKGSDATQQAEEVVTEIRSLAKQAFDNIEEDFENQISVYDTTSSQFESLNDLLETDKGFASEEVYKELIDENNDKIALREKEAAELQAKLDSGEIVPYTSDWYDAVAVIGAANEEIINLQTENENLQDSINELHWDKFDLLIKQYEGVSQEAGNLIDILGTQDAVDELGNWTDEGITSLGLLAQQMEVSEVVAKEYEDEIAYLNENWQALGYTQEEYIDKLDELKDGQYDAIDSYNDAKDAIVDLNKTRIDAIKDGIEKEIDAYEELIDKKKEELSAEKDLYDFQKGVAKQQKNIADIKRKLAALDGDNSASAIAQRKKLEAELFEENASLEESYYDRSIDNQQNAYDTELNSFKETKQAEIDGWDLYIQNTEAVVADSLDMVQEKTTTVLTTLQSLQEQYGLTINESIIKPWEMGEAAIQSYGTKLNMSLTEFAGLFGMTVDELASNLGMTTEELVGKLDITVEDLTRITGMSTEELAQALGVSTEFIEQRMGSTITELADEIGLTLPGLANRLGISVEDLAGNLGLSVEQFAGKMGISVSDLAKAFGVSTSDMYNTLGKEYGKLTNTFGLAESATTDGLEKIAEEYGGILDGMVEDSKAAVDEINEYMDKYKPTPSQSETKPSSEPKPETKPKTETKPKSEPKPETKPKTETKPKSEPKKEITVGGKINAGNAKIYASSYGDGGDSQYFSDDPIYTVVSENNGYVLVRHHTLSEGDTGWFKKSDVKAYAKGTKGTEEDQWAFLDELGEELVLHAGPNGKLEYLTKGTGVVPADLTERLMNLALNPQSVLDSNRPQIAPSKSVVNNTMEFTIDASVGELIHVEHLDGGNLDEINKLVNKAWEKKMQGLNNSIKKFVR